ncbi:MAG: PKD domain-containing protein [Paludibacteraceae bacterium]|nr:PKD domain-containing protein [Paludibacteraceae bacterium]
MKQIKWILPIIVFSLTLYSCKETYPTPEDFPNNNVTFNFNVEGDYARDFFVGSKIVFNRNLSENKGTATWNFGDNTAEVATENDTISHRFQVAGTYIVKVTIDGESTTRTIFISDIVPSILSEIEGGGLCEVNATFVQLDVELPNPQSLSEEFEWIFPTGTVNETETPIITSPDKRPSKVKFKNIIGSQQIILKTKLGGRTLQEASFNVQVSYTKATKNVYFAVKGGNLMTVKLDKNKAGDMVINPYNLGIKSGQHPFNMFFNDSSLYVLDCGRQFTYINDETNQNMGDGKISVISKDGKKVETMITNVGGYAFFDPFYGYLDAEEKKLYFSDRVAGFSAIALDARNQTMDKDKDTRTNFPYFVQSNRLGYYGKHMQYTSLNSAFEKVNGVWWWAKINSPTGIYRFVNSDILSKTAVATDPEPESGEVCANLIIKSFVVDTKANMLHLVENSANALYSIPLDDNILKSIAKISDIAAYKIADLPIKVEGTAAEPVSVTQLILDKETGFVYFGLCSDNEETMKSGLIQYDPASKTLTHLVEGVGVYGVAINNTKSKLF